MNTIKVDDLHLSLHDFRENNFNNTEKTRYDTTKTTIIFSLKKEKTFIKLL